MEIQIGETFLKVYDNGDIYRIDKRCPNKGYVKCESSPNRRYLHINIDGKDVNCHRIVASVYLGLNLDDPTQIVDHWDHNTLNNDVSNLRVTTSQGNCFNRNAKHYYYSSTKNCWIVSFEIDGKTFTLGRFLTESEAIEKAKDVEKYQIIGDNYIKAEDVVIPKKDLKPEKYGKFRAIKIINGERHYIGMFDTSAEARQARLDFTI